MPKAARGTSGPSATSNRTAPYPKTSPKNRNNSATDKENVDPNHSARTPSSKKGDWRAIELEEVKGEVPCYDNATTVRRKLNKLITDKGTIPGTNKKWNKSTMVAEMQELEQRGHAVEYNKNASGPTARSLGGFLKKSGQMGGGDSPCYYWGNVMLEKLRIYNGEKKSKPRLEAEKEYPGGYVRDDATKRHISMPAGGPAPPDAWKPKARCPAQPEVSLKAFEPEAAPPTTMPTQASQHTVPKMADQPPLLSAGPAPARNHTVPAMACPPPVLDPFNLPTYAPPAPVPVLPLQASSPITAFSRPLAPTPVSIANPNPAAYKPTSFANPPPY